MCRITRQVDGLLNSIQIVLLGLYVYSHASHPWMRAVVQDWVVLCHFENRKRVFSSSYSLKISVAGCQFISNAFPSP